MVFFVDFKLNVIVYIMFFELIIFIVFRLMVIILFNFFVINMLWKLNILIYNDLKFKVKVFIKCNSVIYIIYIDWIIYIDYGILYVEYKFCL